MTRAARIVVYRAKDGWRWRLFAGSRIVADSGEAYKRQRDAVRAIKRLRELLKTSLPPIGAT